MLPDRYLWLAALRTIPAHAAIPANARLLSTPLLGHIASEGYKTIGVHRPPEESVKTALAADQPGMTSNGLPSPMLEAIHFSASHSLEHVGKCRSETMRRFVEMAKQLAQDETALKSGFSARRREILSSKRLLLFKSLLEDSGFMDLNLFQDLCNGFDLTGTLPESQTFARRFKPAHLPTEVLRGAARKARDALLLGVRSSGDFQLDSGVYDATVKEVQKGFLVGPIDPTELPECATLTRRFGVNQKDKIRPIDDYRSSMVNSAVTQVEAVSIHGVDHIAAMCSEHMRVSHAKGRHPLLVAKCWDLSAAYKQVPLSDSACEMDGYLVVYDRTLEKRKYTARTSCPSVPLHPWPPSWDVRWPFGT